MRELVLDKVLRTMIQYLHMTEKQYISIKEFADLFGVSVSVVRDWIEKGAIATTQLVPNGKHFINKLDIPTFKRTEKGKI